MLSTNPVSSTSPLQLFALASRLQNSYTNSAFNITTVAALQGVGSANGSPRLIGLLGFVTFDGAGTSPFRPTKISAEHLATTAIPEPIA